MSRGFNLEFKMFMEGVETPFKSANIICTPNGVEANINILANKLVYDLKPKTAVQIFYKDWISLKNRGWRLMFDGFFSAIVKEDMSTEGRTVGITCRDFRMDIRKAPAYLSYTGDEPLGTLNLYAMEGLYETGIIKGSKFGSIGKIGNREYDNTLCTLAQLMRYIAGTAYHPGVTNTKKKKTTDQSSSTPLVVSPEIRNTPAEQQYLLAPEYRNLTSDNKSDVSNNTAPAQGQGNKTELVDTFQHDEEGKAQCGLFLDSFIRGLWTEAVGGTSVGVFTNKRIRMDKRFLVPSNRAGYNFWNRQSAGIEINGYMMSNSRFTSLEAAIMRCAALFSVRVYSCNTPTLIPVSEQLSAHNPYSMDPYAADIFTGLKASTSKKILDFIVDDQVRKNLIDNPNRKFGAKFILNESMLLPPMEFTAPPNCNIFLPPFSNRISWQFDMDADITRGYYRVTDSMSGYDSTQGLHRLGIQVPNTLFDRSSQHSSLYKGASRKDKYGRYKPPITLEERYKGVSLTYGDVNQDLAMNEVVAEMRSNPSLKAKIDGLKKKLNDLQKSPPVVDVDLQNVFKTHFDNTLAGTQDNNNINQDIQNQVDKKISDQAKAAKAEEGKTTTNALRRHALIKYLNEKYAGRIVTVDMMFNPYPMCGFPGMYVDDEEAAGKQSAKTVIGMVQQVKHLIVITSGSAEASTSVLMNNARFIDEPTDMDPDGNALYLGLTQFQQAEIDIKTLMYKNKGYRVPEPIPESARVYNSLTYDLAKLIPNTGTMYAKDFLSISAKSSKAGRSNIYYLDREYDPQHIPLFYEKVFQHTEHSFMIGTYMEGYDTHYFIYDTMHEAVVELRENRQELLYNYDTAMKFVSRNVCSAEAFYHGILGLSSLAADGKTYITKLDNFDDSKIETEYFGLSTKDYNNTADTDYKFLRSDITSYIKDGKRITVAPGQMSGPGELSSILETTPITAFIKERKEAVKNYINEATKTAQGMRFTAPEEI